jgi:hypothetical protein
VIFRAHAGYFIYPAYTVRGVELSWGPAGGVDPAPIERVVVADVATLDAQLDRLQEIGNAAEPFVVELSDPVAGTLGIVLGRDWSAATHERADGAPPYLISSGDAALGPNPLVCFYWGEWTELPGEAAISIAAAREAMHSFLRDRRIPSNLRWVET